VRAVIEIKGGLGNQLFQFAFAKYLSENRVKVFVNFQNNSEYNLNYKYFGFKHASSTTVKLYKLIYRLKESNKYFFIYKYIFKHFFIKFSKPEEFNLINLKPFNHFDGYWQNVQLFQRHKEFLANSLDNYSSFKIDKNYHPTEGLTLLHVRRGDYIDLNENLDINFYIKALKYCEDNIKNFKFEIFTDDEEWVKTQNLFNNAIQVHGTSKGLDSLLEDVSKMIKFNNFIVGNSSFSLVAAMFSNSFDNLKIIADPWFRNSQRDLNFDESWLKINNY
jgi:hypothetical protein